MIDALVGFVVLFFGVILLVIIIVGLPTGYVYLSKGIQTKNYSIISIGVIVELVSLASLYLLIKAW